VSTDFRAFLRAIDARWPDPTTAPVQLSIIGSSALMLQTDYVRGTNDSDVIETNDLPRQTLEQLAGRGSPLHEKFRLYIDFVPRGLPFLPQRPLWRQLDHDEQFQNLTVHILDVVDVVVSKFKRFNANDQSDIDRMIARGCVTHEALLERFRRAVDAHSHDESLPKYVEHLHKIERDAFGCESEIELPAWI
jgi:hypothetical protein